MINIEDQQELFTLIANYLKKEIECIAIGGTAMMFSGYKNTTKDIDIVFRDDVDRDIFIEAISELGYKSIAIGNIYDKTRKGREDKPLMYSRGDERFDLFVKNVFGFSLNIDYMTERHDFLGKKELTVFVLSKELLVLLNAITNREKDFENIVTIIKLEKNIDWDFLIDLAINNIGKKDWILIDLEEIMQKLKKITFIPSKYFKKIYNYQNSHANKALKK